MEINIKEEIPLGDVVEVPEVVIWGSLGLLLSAYLHTSTPSFHACSSTSGQQWDFSIAVDGACSAHDFLQSLEKSYRQNITSLDESRTFWLRTDSLETWTTSNDKTFHSESSAIPRQILCTVKISETSHSLELQVNNERASNNARFLGQLTHVAKQLLVARRCEQTLRNLDLVCDQDRRDLQQWNHQPSSIVMSTVHEIYGQRVLESPDSQAVEAWDGGLTYLELDILSSRVCLLLLDAGVHQRECIPLLFEKSQWVVVAMLGVLKSGCSFLLMDVSHPTSRLQTLTDEAKATIVLTSSTQDQRAINLVPRTIIVSSSSLAAPARDDHHEIEVSPSDVAVLIFTSGTTGTPKGILIEHKSMCSSLSALAELSGIGRQTRYFQFSSYAFDAGFGEMIMTLMCGGCICIPSDADRLNDLAGSIRSFHANTALLTPTVVRLLSPSDIPSLTTLLCGGEKVTQDIVGIWADKLDLIIAYGPAETTIACIGKKAHPMNDDSVRIGFPINSRAWVVRLDDPNQLAPIGAIGELVAEGPGIARGYINNESGNTELFLDSPAWAKYWESSVVSVGRSYRTGDLVRYAGDGELIFVGRRDRQVKLRGQRIELEDIETKLKQHLQLPGANILLEVIDIYGTDNLLAFLYRPNDRVNCGQDGVGIITHITKEMELAIEELRVRISKVLPAYMWPVTWVPLKDIPVGPTGKLDRRKLVSLGKDFCSKLRTGGEEDNGLSSIESVLARMWREVLHSSQSLTPDANFFELGGNSLQCMKLVRMANKEGYHLLMENVIKSPTLSSMAIAMQDISVEDNASHLSIVPDSQDNLPQFQLLLEEHGLDQEQVESMVSCTALQAGLFSLSMALPSLYSSQFVFNISATVDAHKFKAAWESAMMAFPILRTAIVATSSSLMQVVLRHHSEWTDVKQDLVSLLAQDKAVSFQPGQLLNRHYRVQDPSSGQSHFVWTLHHAVFDGWSLELVVNHIRRLYNFQAETLQPTTSYQQFVNFCKSLNQEECASFWRRQLDNAPTPSFPNFPKAGHLAVDKSCLEHIMAAPAAATTAITVLARASWALILSQYEGSDDVTFGNSLHGRNSLPAQLQGVVGPTIATLPIRVRIDPNQAVSSFLGVLQEQFSAMIPFEQFNLSQILQIDQDVKSAASFRTLIIVQPADARPFEEGINLVEVERSLHENPLVMTLMLGESQIKIVATFDRDIISQSQVQRILEQFEQSYHELCTVPRDTKIGELDLASRADKSSMFWWNTRHHKAYEVCVHEMIRERVRHSRASPAIYSNGGTMNYDTLDRLSDSLAGELMRYGTRSGSVVGVLFEKSQWAIVSILAIIKAGAAFAPLSPTYPRARLEAIAHDANIKIVLCSPLQENAFPNPSWRPIVVCDDTAGLFTPTTHVYGKVATPESLLYVLSTSGTTGTAKIFGVQHKSFATGAIARAPLLQRASDSRVLQFAPYTFDPSVEDILTTLMFGGCICVPSDEDIMGDISAFMRTARVNFANITPSVAYTLNQNELPDFEILLLSGEAPDQTLVNKWDGHVQVMNGYGPSECSVKCAINCSLSRNDPRNIGFSAGTSLWVVRPENHDRLAPLGAVGELVIESPHLATGYMNCPEANEEKFVSSPPWLREFRDGHSTRIYKTGDLVRYMEDGSLQYIGRGDMQLKLHGQRLEGEEVRQRIQESLSDAQLQVIVDIARFAGQDSDVLVAYLAQKGDVRRGQINVDHVLKQRLADMKERIIREIGVALPKYMIPSVFLAITEIPVTANGKVDRRSLKAYVARQRLGPDLLLSVDRTVQPPASEKEKLLHGLWQKLLGLNGDQFGANSNFFELGGSSLAAIKLAAAARDLGHKLSAQITFKNPVLSAMAAQMVPLKETKTIGPPRFSLLGKIDRSVNELRKSLMAYNIDEQDVEDAYPLTREQQRYMKGEMSLTGGNTYRHIMQLPAEADLIRVENALRIVVQAEAILRTCVVPVSSQLVQVVMKDDYTCRRVEALSSLVFEDRKVSWRFGQALSRFSIVDRGHPQDRWLVWSSSHVIFDGWCRKLILEEIDYAYHHNDVPPNRPQFNRFVEYVYGQRKSQAASLHFKYLEDSTFPSYFSLDGTLVPGITHTFSLAIAFPAPLPAKVSYPTVMLTAWAIAATHIEKRDHFLFKILLNGRDAEFTGIDRLIGPASTTTPWATSINNELTFRENMKRVQEQIDTSSSVKHLVQLGDKLNQFLETVPIIVVHPPEDHEDKATKYLGLIRNRVETVQPLVDAMFMNFCLQPGNVGVDLILTIDYRFVCEDKAVQYLGYLEQILSRLSTPGGLDMTIEELKLDSTILTNSVQVETETG